MEGRRGRMRVNPRRSSRSDKNTAVMTLEEYPSCEVWSAVVSFVFGDPLDTCAAPGDFKSILPIGGGEERN